MPNYELTTLDFYDDSGRLLRELTPDASSIPEFVKTATVISQDNNPNIFALILVDDGEVMKRFPTPDAGNTWLSTVYFEKTHESLPEEAQKVAAANLIEALEAFEFNIPDFLFKVAGGPATTNVVDVTGQRAPIQVEEPDEPTIFAVEREDGTKSYPLTGAQSVKVASDYFEENHRRMPPRERRQFAVKVATEAKKGRLPVAESLSKYASDGYSPTLEAHITTRYIHLMNSNAPMVARQSLIKLAKMRSSMVPEDFASHLEALDREFGLDSLWDRDLADPWYTTFYKEKVAKGETVETKSFAVTPNEVVTEEELSCLAETGKSQVESHFDEGMANAFEKDPVGIFSSMPLPQKRVIARMASAHRPVQ